MYQNYTVASRPEQGPPRLAALRAQMAAAGVNAWLVPRGDAWRGEYVAPCDERLGWLTGFTGSAGFSVVTMDEAGVFIDGRYRLQVRKQVAMPEFTPVPWPEEQLTDWLAPRLNSGDVLGFDPWLHSIDEVKALHKTFDPKGVALKPLENLVDLIWTDRPAPPADPFTVHPLEFAGVDHATKRAQIATGLQAAGADAVVITLTDSIAWLLNIRGTDVAHNPIPHAFLILRADGTGTLFARPGKADDVRAHLGDDVAVQDQADFLPALAALGGKVQIDPANAASIIGSTLVGGGATLIPALDPCLMPKACKNPAEIEGMRLAQDRDAVAMINFLAWLDAEAPKGALTEIDIAVQLEGFRTATNALREISFPTIAGAGPNGAIMHYRVNEESNRRLNTNELMLVDSGGQYADGTTDITRTMLVGTAPSDSIENYTRVLQGLIAISRARFPRGVAGMHLDTLARFNLWTAGRDFDHGTGHGIGAYLSVHEGPVRLSRISDIPLREGMVLSNEPGYYREGDYGIRLENAITVVAAPALAGADARDMLAFETLTYVPFDRRLIDANHLSRDETDWINAYHDEIIRRYSPRLSGDVNVWLKQACAPL
ncbi:Xaa-Pro aminopeptidase [Ketogulonicigenium robustum]|uniref:Xaa-Pro aminopeptidase n=1 Tax=Ketogulonicigenium robustum TaxID=92947 RepID=A0A1W6NZX1_9RHOB|nr:aminopeptidase P family protein [Ketogulonicigenium robustum]ARO14806.1 Xaa-Pro aminopeptidase [Ketogulonicigenium robustum]